MSFRDVHDGFHGQPMRRADTNAALTMQVSQTVSLPPTPTAPDSEGRVGDLARKHAADVARLREAFHARLAALEEELQVHVWSLNRSTL